MVREKYRYEYEVKDDPQHIAFGMDEPPTDVATFDLETAEFEGRRGEAESILREIYESIEERREKHDGVCPRVIILGEYEFTALDAWIRYDSGGKESIESHFNEDIYTVPGRMIHVPITNEFVPGKYLTDD